MKMKKSVLCVLLVAIVLLLLTACNGGGNEQDEKDPHVFVIDGITVTPGKDAGETLAALSGKNPQTSVKSSCLGGVDGEDVTYVYVGFRIQTFRTGESEVIRWVILSDDSVQTDKGISIGATTDAVKTAYGTPTEESGSYLIYESSSTKLRFGHRNGTITNIEYTVVD